MAFPVSNQKNKLLQKPESVARALIAQSHGMGPRLLKRLLPRVESALSLFENPAEIFSLQLEGFGQKTREQLFENLKNWNLEAAREKIKQKQLGVISPADSIFPSLLEEIYDPPPVLFYRGNLEAFKRDCVGIVGTRSCTKTGKNIASELARGLADIGLNVVSGMAAGIDASAHDGALETGKTTAVLGTGVDRIYPRRNKELYRQLVRKQLLVSEYPPGSDPNPNHFPARNRIISGLARAIIVVQAGERSGALITADFALDQGREVYAVPGALTNPKHKGCHMLIKRGAGLVEEVEDIIDYLQLGGYFSHPEKRVEISPGAAQVLSELSARPVHLDELVQKTGFSLGECSRFLLELEKENLVISLPGQRYQESNDTRHLEVEVAEPEGSNRDDVE